MNGISPVSFCANPNKVTKASLEVIDRVNTSISLNGRPAAELREHLIREVTAAPIQGFKNLPIIQGIVDAIKAGKK